MTVCIRYPCVVCGKPCRFKRRRRTCSDTCAQIAIRDGRLAGATVNAEQAKARRAPPYIESNVLFVSLTQGAYTKVDIRDASRVLRYRWYLFNNPVNRKKYAVREERGKRVTLHRWLLNAHPSEDVDHFNGDGLDNRRENLRKATATQNARNARKRKHGTSKYKGVCKDLSRGGRLTWRARIRVDLKLIHLGRFTVEEEAALAYDEAARRLHGEFACVNFPIGDEGSALHFGSTAR